MYTVVNYSEFVQCYSLAAFLLFICSQLLLLPDFEGEQIKFNASILRRINNQPSSDFNSSPSDPRHNSLAFAPQSCFKCSLWKRIPR